MAIQNLFNNTVKIDSDGYLILPTDGNKIKLGTGSDFTLEYTGTSTILDTGSVTASDFVVKCGTAKTLVVYTPVWDDLRITPGSFDYAGSADPNLVNYIPSGSGATTKLYEFALNDIAYFQVQLPHSYKQGGDIKVHLHWTPGSRGTVENGKYVGWKVLYSWANIDGTFGAMQTADLSDACDGTDHKHQMTPEVTIDGHTDEKHISSMLICQVTRTDTGADDDWVSTTTGQLPLLLEIDFHYPIDTIGSRASSSK